MKPKALVIGIHHWHSPMHVGGHAIARTLAERGWKIAYVSAPITPFHWLRARSSDFNERLKVWRSGGAIDAVTGVWHYVPFAYIAPDNRPLLNSNWVFKHWQDLSFPNVVDQVQRRGFGKVDLLLMNSYYQPFWLDAVQFERSVYRMADLSSGFQGHNSTAQQVESHVVRSVDLVVTAGYTLQQHARNMGAREVFALPNGIAGRDFARLTEKPSEYIVMKGKIAVYVGAFGPWFDIDLIDYCATKLPDVHFVLIGPPDELPAKWRPPVNVHVIGVKARTELPAYLQHANVGLIPFDQRRFPDLVDHVHPLKLYEYLICGLPVVSTDWKELRAFDHPAILCDSPIRFVAGIESALEEPEDRRVARETFAVNCDWNERVAGLLDRISMQYSRVSM